MSVTAAKGFVAAGLHCGIKHSGDLDLSLVASADGQPLAAAAVFTSNKMTAAPVLTSAAHLEASDGRAVAVVLNSGNANAANGTPGRLHAEQMCQAVAEALNCPTEQVLVCSTGLIGIPLPVEKILASAPDLVAQSESDGTAAADAILTTDTHRKESVAQRGSITVGGMAKGAAMLAPNMATMLAVLTTDAAAEPDTLKAALQAGVADSFNSLVVDGCTSTNDTVILLASGAAGPVDDSDLFEAVAAVCADLAGQMAGDAEGATKVVTLSVTGASSDEEARIGARKVAMSQLTKCSWYGCDPYWGRIASDLGSAGIDFEPDSLSVSYGPHRVAQGGVSLPAYLQGGAPLVELTSYMSQRELSIVADLGIGDGQATVLTTDLTHAYVDENMGTS